MSETHSQIYECTVGNGNVTAVWRDGTAIWLSGYFTHENRDIELVQQLGRMSRLRRAFEEYKLIDPTIEIIEPETVTDVALGLSPEEFGKNILRVTTLLLPAPPIMHSEKDTSGVQGLSLEQRTQLAQDLSAGGQAIASTFGAVMSR